MSDKIYSLDLYHNQTPVSFAIRTMESIDHELGGISDSPHRHNYYTIIWSYTATGRHIIDFKEYPICPQSIFFVSPGQVHQMITDSNPTGLVILFTPEFLQRNSIKADFVSNLKLFRNSDETPPMEINSSMIKRLSVFADGMLEAFDSNTEMRIESIGSYLKLFLIECNGHCSLDYGSNTQNIEVKRTIVQQFKSIVENHFREWHQVKKYAEKLNVTPSYLNDVIKLAIGISAKDFIQNRLILEAKRMSVFTDKSIKEIGFELGFDDPSHFSKFFKNCTGKSFTEFKEIAVM
jgi:AraC family transcriptional regulator, transcriptional activator of pobA